MSAAKGRRSSNTPPNKHVWPFGAIAELVSSAATNSTTVHIHAHTTPQKQSYLSITDNGPGCTLNDLRFRLRVPTPTAHWYLQGAYASPWQAAAFRLAADVLILSKQPDKSRHIALLSRTRLAQMPQLAQQQPALILDWANLTPSSSAIPDLLAYSPWHSYEAINSAFEAIPVTGTILILYSLKRNPDDAQFELDLDKYPYDILCRPENIANLNPSTANVRLTRSLRSYLELLFLRPKFRMILRGAPVRPRCLRSMLWGPVDFCYTPRTRTHEDGTPGANPGRAKIRLGFDPNAALAEFGILLYCRGRLIRPYVKIGLQAQLHSDVRVVGIVEAEFVTPTPNMQSFERDKYYQGLLFSLDRSLKMFWSRYGTMAKVREVHSHEHVPSWVRCDDCGKWRVVSPTCSIDPNAITLCLKWVCSMNHGGTLDCSAPDDEDMRVKPHSKRASTSRLTYDGSVPVKRPRTTLYFDHRIFEKKNSSDQTGAEDNVSMGFERIEIPPPQHLGSIRVQRAQSFPGTNLLVSAVPLSNGSPYATLQDKEQEFIASDENFAVLRSPQKGVQEPLLDLDGPTPELFPSSMLEFSGEEFSLSRKIGPNAKRRDQVTLGKNHSGAGHRLQQQSNLPESGKSQAHISVDHGKTSQDIAHDTGHALTEDRKIDWLGSTNGALPSGTTPVLRDAQPRLKGSLSCPNTNLEKERLLRPTQFAGSSSAGILKSSSSVSHEALGGKQLENIESSRPSESTRAIASKEGSTLAVESFNQSLQKSLVARNSVERIRTSVTSAGTGEPLILCSGQENYRLGHSKETKLGQRGLLKSQREEARGRKQIGLAVLRSDAHFGVADLVPFVKDGIYESSDKSIHDNQQQDTKKHAQSTSKALLSKHPRVKSGNEKGPSPFWVFRHENAEHDSKEQSRSGTRNRASLEKTKPQSISDHQDSRVATTAPAYSSTDNITSPRLRRSSTLHDGVFSSQIRSGSREETAIQTSCGNAHMPNETRESSPVQFLSTAVQIEKNQDPNETVDNPTCSDDSHIAHVPYQGNSELVKTAPGGPEIRNGVIARRRALFSYKHRRPGTLAAPQPKSQELHRLEDLRGKFVKTTERTVALQAAKDRHHTAVENNQGPSQTASIRQNAISKFSDVKRTNATQAYINEMEKGIPLDKSMGDGQPVVFGTGLAEWHESTCNAPLGAQSRDVQIGVQDLSCPGRISHPKAALVWRTVQDFPRSPKDSCNPKGKLQPPSKTGLAANTSPLQDRQANDTRHEELLQSSPLQTLGMPRSFFELEDSGVIRTPNSHFTGTSPTDLPLNLGFQSLHQVDLNTATDTLTPKSGGGEVQSLENRTDNMRGTNFPTLESPRPNDEVDETPQVAASATRSVLHDINNRPIQKDGADLAAPSPSGRLAVSHLAFSEVAAAAVATSVPGKLKALENQADSAGKQSDGKHSATHSPSLARRLSAPSQQDVRVDIFKSKLQELVCLLAPGAVGGMASWMSNVEELDVQALSKEIQRRQEQMARDQADCDVHQEMQTCRVSQQIACETLSKVRRLVSIFLEQVVGILRSEDQDEPVESQLEEYLHILDVLPSQDG